MHQYEIEASIKNAVNSFVVQLGWINEVPRVQSIRPSDETGLLDDQVMVKKVSVSVGPFSFDFLAILESPHDCVLYMDSRSSILLTELKMRELADSIKRQFKAHLADFPHNMGM